MKLSVLPQFNRDARRFKEIVQVLLKYGLANWIKETDPDFIKGLFKDPDGHHLVFCTRLADFDEAPGRSR